MPDFQTEAAPESEEEYRKKCDAFQEVLGLGLSDVQGIPSRQHYKQPYQVEIEFVSPAASGRVQGYSSVSIDNALANATNKLRNPTAVLSQLK